MPRMSSVTPRRGDVVPRGTQAASPRSQTHLLAPSRIAITPEAIAGLAILSLASVSLLGSPGVMLFIVASLAVIAMRPISSLHNLVRFSPLLLLPMLAILSTIWSDAPQLSMRAGLELFLTFAATIAICTSSRPQTMILALFVSCMIIAMFISPYIPASYAQKTALVAGMGSKNQVGFVGFLLFALGLGISFDPQQNRLMRWLAVITLTPALLIIYLSQSGGTTSTVVLTLMVFPPLALLGRFSLSLRIVFGILAVCLLIAASFFSSEIDAAVANFRQSILNKDATFTGRTYLWTFAERLAAIRPVWGYGYASFWRQGNIDAEGLWRWGGVPNRSGFNFHNAYLEIRVDLGLVGFFVLVGSCIAAVVAALVRQVVRPSVSMACLIATALVMLVRSYVEDGLLAPFSVISVIWLATGIYAFSPEVGAKRVQRSAEDLRSIRGQIFGRDRALVSAAVRKPLRDGGRSGQGLE